MENNLSSDGQSGSSKIEWPKSELESVDSCPVCNCTKRASLYSGLSDKVFYCAPGLWDLYQCTDCSSAFLDPRPSESSIGQAYASYFTHAETLTEPEWSELNVFHKVRRALANGYRNFRFGSNLQPSLKAGVLVANLFPALKRKLDFDLRNIPRLKPGMRLLDIGCGNGAFLIQARKSGWDVVGVDPDETAVRMAKEKGLDVRNGGLELLTNDEGTFDVITLSHVIEHVHSPVETLRNCFKLLKPGGWIWIDTPNLNAQGHSHYGKHWIGLDPPRHLVLFTYNSLRKAIEGAGFSDVSVDPYKPLCEFNFGASQAISDGELPFGDFETSAETWDQIAAGEKLAKKDRTIREFLTVRAQKPK